MNFKILTLLAEGEYSSGSELGDKLGVSRAAVWKYVKQLQAQGIPIVSHKGKGYCWEGGGDLLDAGTICHQSGHAASLLEVFAEVESTNKIALGGVLEGRASGYACFAELQTGGRGRRGRVWSSPLAQNLYFSTIFRVSGGVQALQGLSLVVGISLAETINTKFDVRCQVKWPNDLIVSGKKLGGILVELAGDASGDCAAVIGIGINCNMATGSEEIDQPWTSLVNELDGTISRNDLAADIMTSLPVDLQHFSQFGFESFIDRWNDLDVLSGRQVVVGAPSQLQSGTALGVDELGGLRVQTSLGAKVFYGGEVSVRLS